MTDIRRIGDAGIHTVEGNVAGSRAALLTKQREAQQQQYESVKQKIKDENASGLGRIDDKFSSGSDHLEQEFKRRTVGLVSADAFRKARVEVDNSGKSNLEAEKLAKAKQREAEQAKKEERAQKRKKSMASSLSFSVEDDDDEETRMKAEEVLEQKKKKLTKNPNVDTSYLPDKERDEALQEEKERLRQEWIRDQEKIKNELLSITYSYWDGSGHRKEISVKKGTSVGRFLELVKQQLVGEFHEMRLRAADSLLYVKEDLIIPHHLTFYDLIVTKARGKSGPLFHFDVHDDVRMLADATVEKEESHPGKVVDRHWYEKNKHIFPASRWEVFDPTVKRTDKYTIHGSEVN